MAQLAGTRVLRGPHWEEGDTDGGEGYLGTVVGWLPGEREVRVQWDMGHESTCSTGKGGKFDLRVFDTAPIGIRHEGTRCAECGEEAIGGTLWRCELCPVNYDLCSGCYSDDRHDTRHPFLRFESPNTPGQPKPKRKTSVKVRTIGLHPGAKVVRGKDWEWGDQDGGQESEGEVQGHENAPGAPRGLLRVRWPNGSTHSYRLGVGGKVDVTCVEEEVGGFYYRDHLPLLDTTETSTLLSQDSARKATTPPTNPSSTTTTTTTANSTSADDVITHFADATVTDGKPMVAEELEDEELNVGDRVVIKVDEEELQRLQKGSGGCTARMLRCIGRTGDVTGVSTQGIVSVRFGDSAAKISYRLNPKALLKVASSFSQNDVVRIRADVTLLKALNQRVGWSSAMDKTASKVGRVVSVDKDGDLRVDFQGTRFTYSPACCLPVAASSTPSSSSSSTPVPVDALPISSPSSSQASASVGESEHGNLFRHLREMVQGEGRKGQGHSVRSLFAAIEHDDSDHVRQVCDQDPSMVEREHQGVTPLIFACLRGRRTCAETLLGLGADVNRAATEDHRKTPLCAVTEGKSEELAELLLSRGADAGRLYRDGHTLAHMCVLRNKVVILQALASHGADLNVKDDNGFTPLHLAIKLKEARGAVMEALVSAPSVDVHVCKDHGKFDMLQYAAFVNNIRAVEVLLARGSSQVERLMEGHSSALHIAAANDNVECVRLLILQGGANIDARQGRTNQTALIIASHSARLQTAEALLELGADVNLSDCDQDTALHLAIGGKVEGKREKAEVVIAHRIQIANLLISNGAFVDALDKKGKNAFSFGASAVRNGVKAFMKHNPDIVRMKQKEAHKILHSLGVSELSSTSPGQLREALKGVRLPCGVCGALKSEVTLKPCHHQCVCRACWVKVEAKVARCPLCDAEVEDSEMCVD